MFSVKCEPFCLGPNVFKVDIVGGIYCRMSETRHVYVMFLYTIKLHFKAYDTDTLCLSMNFSEGWH